MTKFIQPIILCGGHGTRLWPISRQSLPKQFVPMFEGKSLFELTLDRIGGKKARTFFKDRGFDITEKLICIGSASHKYEICEILDKSEIPTKVVLETVQKNTAFAMVIGALVAENTNRNSILIFCPSDHYIKKEEDYLESLALGLRNVCQESIFTLGIKPTFPSTAYGYIEVDSQLGNSKAYQVKSFIEKPTLEKAKTLWSQPEMFWNAGSFMCFSNELIDSLNRLEPKIVDSAIKSLDLGKDMDNLKILDEKASNDCPEKSIDYALMEKYNNLKLVPLRADWSDVGSWNAVSQLFAPDNEGNRSNNPKNVFFKTKNSFIYSTDRLVIGVGVENLVVVETSDVVMVLDINHAEDVKNVVSSLDKSNIPQTKHHRKVNRPWGEYDSVDSGPGFKVKKIVVKPGGKLSLQRHQKRAEHWIVVKGKARVTRASEVFELAENESTYIPLGMVHRLENPHEEPLEIIEVQTGTYFGEDDIERFDDVYGRVKSVE